MASTTMASRRLERVARALQPLRSSGATEATELASPDVLPPGVPPLPERTESPQRAFELVRKHGIAILRTGLADAPATSEAEHRRLAVTMPRTIFGDELARHKMPERIAGGGWNGREWVGHRVSGPDRSHMPNAAHMDSPPWGDLKSDYFLMYSAEQPQAGGESWFLDGYGIMEKGLEQRHQHTLWTVPTQNVTARNRGGEPVWRSIPAKRTRAGRIMLRVPNGGCAPAHPFAAGSCSCSASLSPC